MTVSSNVQVEVSVELCSQVVLRHTSHHRLNSLDIVNREARVRETSTRRFSNREGYVVGLPTGVPKWVYNNGLYPLVLVTVVDTNNRANQQDRNARQFFVAGNPQENYSLREANTREVSERPKPEAERAASGLEVLNPQQSPEGEQQVRSKNGDGENSRRDQVERRYNGVEETFCTLRLQHNVNDPSQAGVFNPRAGRVTNVNSNNLPVLTDSNSAFRKASTIECCNVTIMERKCHGVHYFVRGIGQVQMVDDNGNTVFDGWFRRVKF
ncbi:hypothetical protein GH714_004740 [Hevea brasiliensis]|uniref:Cupin type-1 domain-containing protein n=1 Tax=Hevea brasiliensis TaxID=3981 RepID=A0A6A6K9F5_HEVBR|nr:hypothetical protein GH714_004740 [Hevea brasiliensis]